MISFVVLKVDDVRFLIEDYLKNEVHIIFKKWRGKFIIHYDNTKQQPTEADCCVVLCILWREEVATRLPCVAG